MKYRTIVADPPWPMPTGGPRGGTRIWNPGVPSALPYAPFLEATYDVVRGWKFRPSQVLVWAKTPRGLGMGGAFTTTTEFVVFAWRGTCAPNERQDTSWWNWSRGAHSAKPDAFLDIVERVSPGPRLEMFARRARFGWDYWGDESLGTAEIQDAV